MVWLELKVPPAVVFLVAAFAIYLCSDIGYQMAFYNDYKHTIFHVVFALGVLCGISGVVSFKLAKTTVNPVNIHKASELVDSDVFRFSRNPMYLGMLIGLLAIFLRQQALLNVIWLVLFVLYMNKFQIAPEERALTKIFGASYTDYLTRVRRWL